MLDKAVTYLLIIVLVTCAGTVASEAARKPVEEPNKFLGY